MATNTTKLGLIKPDFVDVVDISELNSNADDIDAAVGAAVVTSSTRPAVPWSGQIIHETDTDKTLVWDGVAWVETGTAVEDLDDLGDVTITTPVAGEKLVFDGTNWVNLEAYAFVETVYFTSNGTFTKATYPWLRAIRVKCQGAGGGSGGCAATSASQVSLGGGGGAGGYSEAFITDIAGLASSVTVTRGGGGAGATAGNNNGNGGGASSFGALVAATGGGAGGGGAADTPAKVFAGVGAFGSPTAGDFGIDGNSGRFGFARDADRIFSSVGGDSFFSGSLQQNVTGSGSAAVVGLLYGGGATGGANVISQSARAGAAGGNGIVIVELYA